MLEIAVSSLIMLIDYPLSLTNADILGQGNLNLVREKSGKSQGILLSNFCGNPVVEIDHEIISTVILLPSVESFKKGCCQLQAKVCHKVLVNCLFKPAQEKVWLGELTVPS